MIYGYARVSTKGQDKHGNSLQDQIEKLKAAGCEKVFVDSFTGTKMDRPQFNEVMRVLQPGDVLVVTKLDRFARTAEGGAKTVEKLVDNGIEVNVLNMGRADNTPTGKLMVTIMLAFAQFERDMIVERTAAGKAVAKANNPEWREGRKNIVVPDFDAYLAKNRAGEMSVTECCKQLRISRSTWYNLAKGCA